MQNTTKSDDLCKLLTKAIARQTEPVCAVELSMEIGQKVPEVRHCLSRFVAENKIEQDGDLYWCEHDWIVNEFQQERHCQICDRHEPLPMITSLGSMVSSLDVPDYKLLLELEEKFRQQSSEIIKAEYLSTICDRKLYRFDFKDFYSYLHSLSLDKQTAISLVAGYEVCTSIKNAPSRLKEKIRKKINVRLKSISKASPELQLDIGYSEKSSLLDSVLPESPQMVCGLIDLSLSDRLEIWYLATSLAGGTPEQMAIDDLAKSKRLEISNRQVETFENWFD